MSGKQNAISITMTTYNRIGFINFIVSISNPNEQQVFSYLLNTLSPNYTQNVKAFLAFLTNIHKGDKIFKVNVPIRGKLKNNMFFEFCFLLEDFCDYYQEWTHVYKFTCEGDNAYLELTH